MNFKIVFSVVLLITGILIFLTNGFGNVYIRSYAGDLIAIWFLYSLLNLFTNLSIKRKFFSIFIFALSLEIFQFFYGNFLKDFGGTKGQFIDLFIGKTFDLKDIFIYLGSLIIICLLDLFFRKRFK